MCTYRSWRPHRLCGYPSIHDLNLINNTAIIFAHIHFHRFTRPCLLRGFNCLNHADAGFFTEGSISFEECLGRRNSCSEHDSPSQCDDFYSSWNSSLVRMCRIADPGTTEHILFSLPPFSLICLLREH